MSIWGWLGLAAVNVAALIVGLLYARLVQQNQRELARLIRDGTITAREAARLVAACKAGLPYMPVAKRGGHQPSAEGPAPTEPPTASGPPTRFAR